MGWFIAAGIFFSIAAGLGYGATRAQKRAGLMAATDTSTVELLESMASDLSGSSLSYLTEVKGMVVADNPLVSELSQTECVYYSMKVEREYEEEEYETDSDGNRRRTTHTRSQTVSQNKRSLPFYVQDSTGKIQVRPEGAQLIAEKVVDRFEPEGGARSGLSMGSFNLDINIGRFNLGSGSRTLGYRFTEEVIPINRDIYVLGEASGNAHQLAIKKPASGPMIVSVKSEEQLQQDAGKSGKAFLFGAAICAVIAAICLVMGLK
ncbi:MAG: E3 ubiquitin ligase family protein [Cyanobacteria bacterium J06597_1]